MWFLRPAYCAFGVCHAMASFQGFFECTACHASNANCWRGLCTCPVIVYKNSMASVPLKRTGSAVYETLSEYGKKHVLLYALYLNPLLDHFLRDRAKVFGVSQAEFVRRIIWNTMEDYIKHGLYTVPQELVASSKTEIRLPSPARLQNLLEWSSIGRQQQIAAARKKSTDNLVHCGKTQSPTKTKTKNINTNTNTNANTS